MNVQIVPNTHPNGDAFTDATNQTRDWLVGQMVDMYVYVQTAPNLLQNVSYQWDVPGNVLRDYVIDSTSATIVQLGDSHDGNEHEPLNGKKQSTIKFFWVSTSAAPPGPDTRRVSVTVTNVGGANLPPLSTTFRVFSPAVTQVRGPEEGKVTADNHSLGFFSADENANPQEGDNSFWGGFSMFPQVDMPAGWGVNSGLWNYVQLVDNGRYQALSDGRAQEGSKNGRWVLDALQWPTAPYNDAHGFTTGMHPQSETKWADSPSSAVDTVEQIDGQNVTVDSSQADDHFQTFVMFLPPGAGSRWVPLLMTAWDWKGSGSRVNGNFALDPGSAAHHVAAAVQPSAPPVWNENSDAQWDPVD